MNWKNVYVFISSTFNDMHAERDYLIKDVFPALAEWCEAHSLRLVDIDLRWGVTESDANKNKNTVKICMERIDECRPFFLCFLGQRRGWVPKPADVSAETTREYPALEERIGRESVTEMEILHALYAPFRQNGVPMPAVEHAFFFLREPGYLQCIPRDLPALYQTYTNESIADAQERAEADAALQGWREKIAADPRTASFAYTAGWDNGERTPELMLPLSPDSDDEEDVESWEKLWEEIELPKEEYNRKISTGRLTGFRAEGQDLSEVVTRQLKAAIRQRFPGHFAERPAGDAELQRQREFMFGAAQGYVELPHNADALDSYIKDESRRLLVLASPAGMGKSMLLANWAMRQEEAGRAVYARFVGGGLGNVDALLHSLVTEIAGRSGLPIPDVKNVREQFARLLQALPQDGKTIVVLDGLNQLDSRLTDMNWLPLALPPGVKLVASIKSGEPDTDAYLRALEAQGAQISKMHAFETAEQRKKLANVYLSQYLKGLDDKHLDALAGMEGAGNPLFLKIILSELRTYGSFRTLMEQIKSGYGHTPLSAFGHVLERLESQPAYTSIPPQQTAPLVFSMLACSRRGLSVGQMAQVFALREQNAYTYDEARRAVSLIVRQMRQYLIRSENRIDFLYESLRMAAAARYRDSAAETHALLARMFRGCADPAGDGAFVSDELQPLAQLPYHLYESGKYGELEELMTDIRYLDARCAWRDVYPMLADFAYAPLRQCAVAQELERFITQHAQRLLAHDNLFFSLLRHKGVAKAKTDALLAGGGYGKPWIEAAPVPLDAGFLEERAGGGIAVAASITYGMARIGALSGDGSVSFFMEKLGVLRAIDTGGMRLLDRTIPVSASRPLTMCSDKAGRRIAIAYENGRAELYGLTFENGELQYAQKEMEFAYYLPEFEDPVMLLEGDALYIQKDDGVLGRVCGGELEEIPLEQGEVSGMAVTDAGLAVALRQGDDTLVFCVPAAKSVTYERRDVTAVSALKDGKMAIAFSDGNVVALDGELHEIAAQKLEEPAVVIAECESGIEMFSDNLHMWYKWDWEAGAPQSTDVIGVFAGRGVRIRALDLLYDEGGMTLVTDQAVFRYGQSADGGGRYTVNFAAALPDGGVAYSLRESQNRYWVGLASGKNEYLYQTDNNLILRAAMDGGDRVLLANPVGGGIIVDVNAFAVAAAPDVPAGLAGMAAGGEGFFLAERTGGILHLGPDGAVRRACDALQGGIRASSAWLRCFDDLLVWRGIVMDEMPGIRVELPATLLRFFAVNGGALRELGLRTFSKRDGEVRAIAYDSAKRALYIPMYIDGEGTMLRRGTADEFIQKAERCFPLEAGAMTDIVCADALYTLDRSAIYAVAPDTGKTLATLGSDLPFTAVCANPFHDRPAVLVERERELFLLDAHNVE